MKLFSHLLPYLLLVSFSAGPMKDFGLPKMEALNKSPYDGAAVPLTSLYDTGRFSMSDFDGAVRSFRERSVKQIWPWIFFNRFLGSKAGGKTHSPRSNTPAFRRIKGMDLYNEEGALGDFFSRLGISLLIARKLGTPGIVIDPEFYNDYGVSGLPALAKRMGKPEDEVKKRLEAIGARMCDITDKQYPGATLWFLDTGLAEPLGGGIRSTLSFWKGRRYRAFTYIVRGLLERAGTAHSRITVVSGGEISLTYCQESLEGLKQNIKQRGIAYEGLLKEYPNLALGGTIAPWVSREAKRGWMKKDNCASSKISDLEGFRPLIRELLVSYNYVWIYGAWAGGYDPFNVKSGESLAGGSPFAKIKTTRTSLSARAFAPCAAQGDKGDS